CRPHLPAGTNRRRVEGAGGPQGDGQGDPASLNEGAKLGHREPWTSASLGHQRALGIEPPPGLPACAKRAVERRGTSCPSKCMVSHAVRRWARSSRVHKSCQNLSRPPYRAVSKWDIIVLSFAPPLRRRMTCFVVVPIGFLVLPAAARRSA